MMADSKSQKTKIIVIACIAILIIAICAVLAIVLGKNNKNKPVEEENYSCDFLIKDQTATFTMGKGNKSQKWEVVAEEDNHLEIETKPGKKSDKIVVKADGTYFAGNITFLLKDEEYTVYEITAYLISSGEKISVDILSQENYGKKLSGKYEDDYSFKVEKLEDRISITITQNGSKTYNWVTENGTDLFLSSFTELEDGSIQGYILYDSSAYSITEEKQLVAVGEKEIKLCEVKTQTAIKLTMTVDEAGNLTVDNAKIIEYQVEDPVEKEKKEFSEKYATPNFPANAVDITFSEKEFCFETDKKGDEVTKYGCGRVYFYVDGEKMYFMDIKNIDLEAFEDDSSMQQYYLKDISQNGIEGKLYKVDESYFVIWKNGENVNCFACKAENEERFLALWQDIRK